MAQRIYRIGAADLQGIPMANIEHLLAQRAALEKQIDAAQKEQRSEAIAKVRALMEQYGLSASDISPRKAAARRGTKSGKVPAKYRNAATGESWSGRGLQPKWLKAQLAAGRKLGDFAL